jgi:hypothetical protein
LNFTPGPAFLFLFLHPSPNKCYNFFYTLKLIYSVESKDLIPDPFEEKTLKLPKKNYLALAALLVFFGFNYSCQEELAIQENPAAGNTGSTAVKPLKPTPVPKPKASATAIPDDDLVPGVGPTPDENETVGTDTEVKKTNIDWKVYNPVIKGKKYTYVYSIKDGTSPVIQTDILREITEVDDKIYKFRQTIITSGKDSQLRATEITVQLNNDYSPPIIPPNSVGGATISTASQVDVNENPEKVKVPFKEFDAVKVVSVSGGITTTNWYGKDTGLIKAIQETKGQTYTLELKDFK